MRDVMRVFPIVLRLQIVGCPEMMVDVDDAVMLRLGLLRESEARRRGRCRTDRCQPGQELAAR
jgi:hypothetical protein